MACKNAAVATQMLYAIRESLSDGPCIVLGGFALSPFSRFLEVAAFHQHLALPLEGWLIFFGKSFFPSRRIDGRRCRARGRNSCRITV